MLAYPDPLYTKQHHSDNLNRAISPFNISREPFSHSSRDCIQFTDRIVRNELMSCHSLTVGQQIQRMQRWFALQEQVDITRGVCSLMYFFSFKQVVDKVSQRFNKYPTRYNHYNRRHGLTRLNNTTGRYEVVLYKCL